MLEVTQMTVDDVTVDVIRKPIRHLYLLVKPPQGQVRVTAPLRFSEAQVRLAIVERLPWIRRNQARIAKLPQSAKSEMQSGETHWFMGRAYRLELVSTTTANVILRDGVMQLHARVNATIDQRRKILEQWYREQLQLLIPPLVHRWCAVMQIDSAPSWHIKKMKTKWGTCNPRARRIWLALELAKMPAECLEYVVVHELVHLFERGHGKRFKRFMDRFMPDWRQKRRLLKQPQAPLTA